MGSHEEPQEGQEIADLLGTRTGTLAGLVHQKTPREVRGSKSSKALVLKWKAILVL